jgi:NADH:ubiquinone oxidoreductase subunit K
VIVFQALLSNFLSFLRVFVFLEALLLIAGVFLVSSSHSSEAMTTGGLFSALIILTLAGTEAALSLTLLISLSLAPRVA